MNIFQQEVHIINWLKNYATMKNSIEYLNEAIDDIACAGMGVNTTKDALSKTNNFASTTEDAAIELSKLNTSRKIENMQIIINAVDAGLETLSLNERIVIESRCIRHEYYYQFCYKIGYSERTAKRIRKEALRKMALVIFGTYTTWPDNGTI